MFRAMKQSVYKDVLLIAALIFAVLMPGCVKDKSLEIGERAPEISAFDLSGKTVKLSDFKDKVVVLRFWISGCKACIAEMPLIDEISKRYKEQGLAVLALNMGDSREKAEKFARTLNISYPVLLDPARITVGKYNIRAVPTTIIIDRRGIARKRVAGEMMQGELEKTVVELL